MKQHIWHLLLVSILCSLSACSKAYYFKLLKEDAIIVAMGDSLTYGTGAVRNASYPSVLQKIIKYHVINAGIPGDSTADGLERLPGILQKYQPGLVIVCLGGNDMLRQIPKQQIINNLTAIINKIKSERIQVLLIAVPQPTLTLAEPDFYEMIAKQEKVPLLSGVLKKLLAKRENKSDAIHLNAEGYTIMAEDIAKFLVKYDAIRAD